MELTFASYNIHKAVGVDGRFDPDRIIRVLRELRADIIALQECDRRFGERESVLPKAMLDDTPWHAADVARRPRSLGWHGNALLVRRDIKVGETEALHLPTLEPRGAIRADLECEGKRIRVLGMHLDLSGLRRREQVQAVLDHCNGHGDGCPTVLMGDFNQWGEGRRALRELRGAWQVLETGRSFPSRRPLASLDRIVASPDWTCHDARVHHSPTAAAASDHLPVVARLAIA
ncbi:endonuclease [Altererythrobacter salegens]|uniref:Endonuclease n=1 Tax=Croceibacterium salegens TaxID=1737568 RepID=A0A6I4SZ63_9SPHN|nr:endonuclease/exonuclease/phosphatase family protein [Croceibacterium salegens]MXO60317.1 endonuclease [Croceibacterium salegens]